MLGKWFTSVLQESESPEVAGYEPGSCPRAEQAAQHLINLPTHPRVSERDARMLATELIVCACPLSVFAYTHWAVRRPWRVVTAKSLAVASVAIQAVGVTCYDIAKSAPVKRWPSDFVAAFGNSPLMATTIVIGGLAATWLWVARRSPVSAAGPGATCGKEGSATIMGPPVGAAVG